jgi:hypothetical protein
MSGYLDQLSTDLSYTLINQQDIYNNFSQVANIDPSNSPYFTNIFVDVSNNTGLLSDMVQTLSNTESLIQLIQQNSSFLDKTNTQQMYQIYLQIGRQTDQIEAAVRKLEMENTRQDRQGFYTAEQTYNLVRYYGILWWIFCLVVAVFGVLLFMRVSWMPWKVKAGLLLVVFLYPVWAIWLESWLLFGWRYGKAWVYGRAY